MRHRSLATFCGSARMPVARWQESPRLRICFPTGTGTCIYDGRTVEPAFRFVYVFFGAVVAAFYARDSPSGIHRIRAMFPKLAPEIHERVAFIVGLLIGATAGFILYDGNDPIRAMVTGASSVAMLKQIVRK